jgi:hypothetical protein
MFCANSAHIFKRRRRASTGEWVTRRESYGGREIGPIQGRSSRQGSPSQNCLTAVVGGIWSSMALTAEPPERAGNAFGKKFLTSLGGFNYLARVLQFLFFR